MKHKGRKSRTAPKRRVYSHVYFLSCRGYIKIGTARDAAARQRAIQTAVPFEVRLLCAIPGNEETERGLHRKFWDLRERGEWFRVATKLTSHIEKCRAKIQADNLQAWLSVAICDECGRETRCDVRRAEALDAVVPMEFKRNAGCIGCMLSEAQRPLAGAV